MIQTRSFSLFALIFFINIVTLVISEIPKKRRIENEAEYGCIYVNMIEDEDICNAFKKTKEGSKDDSIFKLVFNESNSCSITIEFYQNVEDCTDFFVTNFPAPYYYYIDSISVTDLKIIPTNMKGLFHGLNGTKEIIGLENFNTSKVTNMANLFAGSGITAVNLSNFETSLVTDMSGMFSECNNLTSIDVSSFDTSSVKNMSQMFARSSELNKTLNELTITGLSNFDTSSVADMSSMFAYCTTLKSINISNFDTSKVTNMSKMFSYCMSLNSSEFSNFDTSLVEDMNNMFSYYGFIENIEELNYDDISSFLILNFGDNIKIKKITIDVSNFKTSKVVNMDSMFCGCYGAESIDISGFDTSSVQNMGAMFKDCQLVKELNVSKFDTSSVKNMSFLFSGCDKLENITLSNFKTSKVIDMEEMFASCTELKSLDLSSFDTSSVENMRSMFLLCSSLDNINLSNFDTSKVTNMESMFDNCLELTSIDLSSFDTSSVESMSSMFSMCTSLDNVTLSNFDTSKVTNMEGMFAFTILKSLDLSSFDTSSVENMKNMFYTGSYLEEIDLSSFDTSKLTTMEGMFSSCESLKSIDLSHFDTSSVVNMNNLFSRCEKLQYIDISNFNMKSISSINRMFYHNNNLKYINLYNVTNSYNNLTNSELSEIDGLFVCQNDETITFEKAKDCCDYDYESGECYDLESISTTYLNEETTDYTNYSDYTDYIDINGTNYSDYIQYSSSNIVNTHTSIPTQIININNPTAILLGFSKFNMLVSSFTFWIHFINIRDFIYSSKLIFSVEIINKSLLRMLDTKEANCTKDDSIKDTASYLCEVSAETANIGQIKANTDFNFSSQNVSVIGISPVANAYINNIQNVGNEDLNLTVYTLDHSIINKSETDLVYNISGIIESNQKPSFKDITLQVNSEDDDNTFKDVENVNCNLANMENNSYTLNCKGKKNVNYNLQSATYNNGSEILIVNFDEKENSLVKFNSTSSNSRATFRKSKTNKASLIVPIVVAPVAVIAIVITAVFMLKKKPEKVINEGTAESTIKNINLKM